MVIFDGQFEAWPVWERRQSSAAPKRALNAHAQDFTMPRFPTGAATPRIHRGAFRALAGNLPRQQLRTHELASKVRQQTVGGLEICRLHTFNESLEYGL